jgi:hypothetical protein
MDWYINFSYLIWNINFTFFQKDQPYKYVMIHFKQYNFKRERSNINQKLHKNHFINYNNQAKLIS